MLFWLMAAALTLLASLSVLLPLARRPVAAERADGNDLRVYKDQLAEVDRDQARGAISAPDAEQAKAEIGRRIMRVAATRDRAPIAVISGGQKALTLALVLLVPVVSWGLYGLVGSPDLPAQPLQARLEKPPAEATPDELIARAEAHLAQNPDDAEGWDVLAPTYLRLGRYEQALTAYGNALRLRGESPERLSGLAEARTLINGGVVSAEAEQGFRRALALHPKQPTASFYLALATLQDGKAAEAISAWKAMLDDPMLDGSMRASVADALRRAGAPVPQTATGPSAEEMQAAQSMTPEEQRQMIESMVGGLDERLRANPDDPEGWMRLVQSYMVLNRPDDARGALKRAVGALGKESDAGKQVAAFAAQLGLSVTE